MRRDVACLSQHRLTVLRHEEINEKLRCVWMWRVSDQIDKVRHAEEWVHGNEFHRRSLGGAGRYVMSESHHREVILAANHLIEHDTRRDEPGTLAIFCLDSLRR